MYDQLKQYLQELVGFDSISSDKSKASVSRETAEFIVTKLKGVGAEIKIIENEVKENNPLIFAKLGNDPDKKTILFYSHYDVQPAAKEDGWVTEPFKLVEKDGYLYGRGASDDKGPIVATYYAVKELLDENNLNVNVAFLYEGEEESSSGGFEETVSKHKDFFGKIDGILILDTGWFGETIPSMDYGFRGVTYMGIEITGPNQDVHSGHGGTLNEPIEDLIYIMANLKDHSGKVLIDGFYNKVTPLTDDETKLYDNIEFDLPEFKTHYGVSKLTSEDPKELLMNMWRYPSLSLHGIEGAFSGPGAKTVIPGTVIGKVSMRLVPNQDPNEIADLFSSFVTKEFEKLNSGNRLSLKTIGTGDWWYGDFTNFLFTAGAKAIKEHWNIDPSYNRSGGSIPIVPYMEKLFGAPAMGLGIGQSTDGAHSQNEKIRIKNLVGGKEVIKKTLINLAN
ncbi:MAG: M20/M25/M40 family metallo-hydrolase [Candidatus Kariarchaeaceae archaeon]|jgi:acetylornithine deacetylase/succinyl-diaminopimelate desuccinylase-like protein